MSKLENKKTSELIDMLDSLEESDYQTGGKYEEIMGELETREAFISIIGKDYDKSLPTAWEAIKELQEQVKLLKRHKHEPQTGDVMVRI